MAYFNNVIVKDKIKNNSEPKSGAFEKATDN